MEGIPSGLGPTYIAPNRSIHLPEWTLTFACGTSIGAKSKRVSWRPAGVCGEADRITDEVDFFRFNGPMCAVYRRDNELIGRVRAARFEDSNKMELQREACVAVQNSCWPDAST
jgi:hypothetical protein